MTNIAEPEKVEKRKRIYQNSFLCVLCPFAPLR
jgi:hypothetical protein